MFVKSKFNIGDVVISNVDNIYLRKGEKYIVTGCCTHEFFTNKIVISLLGINRPINQDLLDY